MKAPFYTMICVNPIKILSNYYNMITLKIICRYAQLLSSYSRKRDRTERMEQWYGNLPFSPIGLFITDLLVPCVKKQIQTFKPTPVPKIFGTLIKHWIQKKEKKKKKHHFFFIITSLSESRFISSLWEYVWN